MKGRRPIGALPEAMPRLSPSDAHPCHASSLMHLTPLRPLDVDRPMSAGHRFLSAASGLVRVGDWLCVIADDERHLGIFPAMEADGDAGRVIALLPGTLPSEAAARKAVKPDFEILARLPASDDASGALLAIGSGSTPQRMNAVRIELAPDATAARTTLFDLSSLFARLAAMVDQVNLEGAIVRDDRLILFNRGNMSAPATHIFETSLSSATGGAVAEIRLIKEMTLPLCDGVPLSVTDAALLDDGRIMLSAVAEATGDSYADGELAGAALILLDADFEVMQVRILDAAVKVEGITAHQTASGVKLLCVTDADDPDRPSMLYAASL